MKSIYALKYKNKVLLERENNELNIRSNTELKIKESIFIVWINRYNESLYYREAMLKSLDHWSSRIQRKALLVLH
jgi:hypothetical protein